MVAQAVEYDAYSITVVDGTPQSDIVLATVNGAIIEVNITRTRGKGTESDYEIVVVHDTVGTTLLEWSVVSFTVTKGTTITDAVFATVAGASQAAKVIKTQDLPENKTRYDILVVHLNA